MPMRETDEPRLTKVRSDKAVPSVVKSSTDRAELSRLKLRNEIDEPRLEYDSTDRDDPSCEVAKIATEELN